MPSRSERRDELVSLILGNEVHYTNAEVAEKGGLTLEQSKRLWRALGFPDPGDEPAFGDADIEAVAIVSSSISNEILDEETVFRLTRALGQTMSRLADWQVSTLVDQIEADVDRGKSAGRLQAALALAVSAGPGFERLMTHAWRRHLAAAATRLEAQGAHDSELLSTTMTIGFADLTRFTALSNRLEDGELGNLVELFEDRCGDIVTLGGGRIIKSLGDAMLFVHPDPVQATRVALDIVRGISSREDLPDVRVGLATGSVISRLGDVYGPPVNLAARLSQLARSNRVIVDDVTAATLAGVFETRALPPRPVKGFGNISPITVTERHSFRHR